MQRKEMELLAVVHIKGQHWIHAMGISCWKSAGKSSTDWGTLLWRGNRALSCSVLNWSGQNLRKAQSHLHFILCSLEANSGMAPQWLSPRYTGLSHKKRIMKGRRDGTLWQNWVASDREFHFNQLWPQIMLSIWGIGTWGQRQQV